MLPLFTLHYDQLCFQLVLACLHHIVLSYLTFFVFDFILSYRHLTLAAYPHHICIRGCRIRNGWKLYKVKMSKHACSKMPKEMSHFVVPHPHQRECLILLYILLLFLSLSYFISAGIMHRGQGNDACAWKYLNLPYLSTSSSHHLISSYFYFTCSYLTS